MSKKYESIFFPADDIEGLASSPKLSGLRSQGYSLISLTLVEDQGAKKIMVIMEPPVGLKLEPELDETESDLGERVEVLDKKTGRHSMEIARLQLTDCKGETHREMTESIDDLEAKLATHKRILKSLWLAIGALTLLVITVSTIFGFML